MHQHSGPHNHSHNHSHHHAPANAAGSAFMIGILLNAGYVVAEVIAGLVTNSMALLSDAGHNLGDVAGLILSLISFKLAKSKPTESFTYGYKKTTILAALINAVILLIGIGVLGYESIHRFSHPQPVQGGIIAWVAGLGIIINGGSALLFFRGKDSELNSRAAYMHLLMDAVVSICVVIAGIIIYYTGYNWLDPVISLGVLIVILFSTWSLLTESLRLTLDAVPEGIEIGEIERVIKAVPGVENIHHMHIWAMSTMENALTTHLVLSDTLSFDEKMKVINHIKHELEHQNIQHATIELESAQVPCKDVDC